MWMRNNIACYCFWYKMEPFIELLFCKFLGNIRPFLGGEGTDPCSGLLVMFILGSKARMDSSHVSFHTCV